MSRYINFVFIKVFIHKSNLTIYTICILGNGNINLGYRFRYDPELEILNRQEMSLKHQTYYGTYNINYLDEKSDTNNIIETQNESVSYVYESNKIKKFSTIALKGHYDLQEDDNKEYSLYYTYFDECFGVNIDFKRKFYSDNDLKPQDTLTLMFSFKNIGSYKSTNLAVSETDKQDIRWENYNIDNEKFN